MFPVLLTIKKKIGHHLRKFIRANLRRYDEWKYSRFLPGHVFDVKVDDMQFKLAFGEYRLDFAIVERIEGRREPNTVAVMKALIKPNSKVLEIGGCYGYFTTILALCTGRGGRVVTIEATPNTFKILEDNIQRNNLSQVDCYQFFISLTEKDVFFKKEECNPQQALKRLKGEIPVDKYSTVSVPARRLSTFLQTIDFYPDYIFMDIEGFEIDVFEDLGVAFFKRCRPVIVFEQHEGNYQKPKDMNFITRILTENRYVIRHSGSNVICLPE